MGKNYLDDLAIAEEFLEVAEKNLNSSWRTSANRLYFALEKAVTSYFSFKKMAFPKSHQKIWELSSKLLGKEYYSLLRTLYDLRMQADYGNISVFVELNKKALEIILYKVKALFDKIKERMKNEN